MRPPRAALTAFVLLCVVANRASADLIVSLQATTQAENGVLRYSYSLTNDNASTMNVIAYDVAVDTSANLASIMGPVGWLALYVSGDLDISWQSPDPAYDLLPGNSYSFSFTSTLSPESNTYTVLGIDPDSPDFQFSSGMTLSPATSSVPEPRTLALAFLTALCLVIRELWTRSSSRNRGSDVAQQAEPWAL